MKADLGSVDQGWAENVGMGQSEITEIVGEGNWETGASPSAEIGLGSVNAVSLLPKKKRPSNLLFADSCQSPLVMNWSSE